MNTRFIDWIWNVRGSVPLAPGVSTDEAFGRLDPLFREYGTTHERTGATLTFRKKDQPAQDKMSVFDWGVVQVESGVGGAILRYRLASRTLLFCFLAPLLFLGFAQLTILSGELKTPSTEAAAKKDARKDTVPQQNPIDKALGAPAPEKPKKEGTAKEEADKKKPSPTSAYVFAALFAALYVIGRLLEDWLVRNLFRKRLSA